MAFPGLNYAPPAVYTQTLFENPLAAALDSLLLPVFIGEGNENLTQQDLEVVRGSSSVVDQRIVSEDETGRAVVSISAAGVVTRGDFDGVLDRLQVRNFPIVTGDGTGTTSNSREDVAVTVNNEPVVVISVTGATGLVKIAATPKETDEVRVTYFFNRTDTLLTDDVSEQVNPDPALVRAAKGISDVNAPIAGTEVMYIHGDILNATGAVVIPANNVLNLTIDGTDETITLAASQTYTMAQVATAITAARKGTLTGSTFGNQYGDSALSLNADHGIVVKDGSANAILGLATGQADNRVSTFYVYHGPIVDGSNGGVTTTDTSHVVVKVDGVQVIPKTVDGASRAVTLYQAPKANATVLITYYMNTWQDTFDYLAHLNVTDITLCGDVPQVSTYTEEADFVLSDDKIVWGTAALITSGVNTAGMDPFNDTQVVATLVDNRTYMTDCTEVTSVSGGVATSDRKNFTLPFYPTLGNGRSTTIGQSLFQSVANNRIDVPAYRPDVIHIYWGYGVADALSRGEVTVVKVDGLVITLQDPVPPGASVYASFYHNMLVDMEYTLSVVQSGVSGVGTYTMANSSGIPQYSAKYNTGTKGVGLTGITIEFPSGSELSPDLHFEAVSSTALVTFTGPVEEAVSVQFASRVATPAKYAVPGAGLYEFVPLASDRLRMLVHSTAVFTTAGLLLSNAAGHDTGFFASLLGEEIEYTGGTVAVAGQAFDLTSSQDMTLTVDGVDVTVQSGVQSNVDVTALVNAINEAASGHGGAAVAGAAATITLVAANRINIDDYYNGWLVVIGNGAAAATAGQVGTVTDYDGTTGIATVSGNWAGGAVQALDPYYIYNPLTRSSLVGATVFDGPVLVTGGAMDQMRLAYQGSTSGASGSIDIVITADTYATPTALATEITTQLATAVAAIVVGDANFAGLVITCTVNVASQLQFQIQLPGVDGTGYLQVLDATGGVTRDFSTTAGFDTGTTLDGGQAALVQGEIARAYEITPDASTPRFNDRIVLRNRVLPGVTGSQSYHSTLAQATLVVKAGNDVYGLTTGATGLAGGVATSEHATLAGQMGFGEGMNATGWPTVVFHDGSGSIAQNNELSLEIDGQPIAFEFLASATGTTAALGPIDNAWDGSAAGAAVLTQVAYAIAQVPGNPFGVNIAAVVAAGVVAQEGAGMRLTGLAYDTTAKVVIKSGSTAAQKLGFSEGQTAVRTLVPPKVLASALMSNRHATFASWLLTFSAATAGTFGELGLASTVLDAAGAEYLYVQDAPTTFATLGTVSNISFLNTLNNVRDAMTPVTGLGLVNLDGDVGEPAIDGYFVTSSDPNGSGSANDSILNDGVGQDGIVGQTYRDAVTGLTFTILPRGWSTDQDGPWLSYPTGATATFRINVSQTFLTDANIPLNSIPGVELRVANTSSMAVDDTAIVQTFEKGGEQPAVGDIYYVSYVYTKQSYDTAWYTKMSVIERDMGAINPDSPLSLASYLCLINGAVVLGLKQVPRATGESQASLVTYRAAIEDLEGVLPGHALPDIITPLRGDSTALYTILKRSNQVMSSIRYKSERTSIIGVSGGTLPAAVKTMAKTLADARMRLVYPDIAVISLTDALNVTKEYLVDGPMMAAALAGSVVSPNVDVATPWTGRMLVGFTQLARVLDPVEQNQVAVDGITVLEDRPPFLRVRHGLTTDMSNVLMKTPTVMMIADQVQRQSRATLEKFIGIKFLPGVLSQIEGRLSMMFKAQVKASIVGAYQGIKANVASDDPTVAEVEAYYTPVFPLLYIILTFHLRSSLTSA